MKLWALMMVKDEADVLETTIANLHRQGVDGVAVIDNGSTDGTYELLTELHKVEAVQHLIRDEEVGYYQARRMTKLAELVASTVPHLGENPLQEDEALWFLPCDADELWVVQDGPGGVRWQVEQADQNGFNVVQATLWDHRVTELDRPEEHGPMLAMRWRLAQPEPLPKVIFRWQEGASLQQGNHAVTLPDPGLELVNQSIQVRHFQYRSCEHLIRKIRAGVKAYEAAPDLDANMGSHWRELGQLSDEELSHAFYERFYFANPVKHGLVYDPALV